LHTKGRVIALTPEYIFDRITAAPQRAEGHLHVPEALHLENYYFLAPLPQYATCGSPMFDVQIRACKINSHYAVKFCAKHISACENRSSKLLFIFRQNIVCWEKGKPVSSQINKGRFSLGIHFIGVASGFNFDFS